MVNVFAIDLKGRITQPDQARYQEGQAKIRTQLLPSQGLPLELRRFPSGKTTRLPQSI